MPFLGIARILGGKKICQGDKLMPPCPSIAATGEAAIPLYPFTLLVYYLKMVGLDLKCLFCINFFTECWYHYYNQCKLAD